MQNFQALGAPPPDPQTPLPHCKFLATRLSATKLEQNFILSFCPKLGEEQKKTKVFTEI